MRIMWEMEYRAVLQNESREREGERAGGKERGREGEKEAQNQNKQLPDDLLA